MSSAHETTVHDMNAHRATYEGMLTLFKAAIPVVGVIAALVIFLLSH